MKRFAWKGVFSFRYGLVALGLLALVTAAGVGRRPGSDDPSPESKPVPVRTSVIMVRPQRETLHRTIEQPGKIKGFEQTALYSKIPGFVRAYHFDIGDSVRKGQLLAELWVPEVVEDLHQKEATVHEDEVLIVQAREMLRVAEAKVFQAGANLRWSEAGRTKAEATRAWWKSEHKRVARLLRHGASPLEEMEQTTEKFQTAEAALAEAIAAVASAKAAVAESEAQRDKAAADVRVAEARLRVGQADRDRAAAILGYARIEAPYDGVVTRRGVDTGDYVQSPGGNTTAASPLFELVQTDLVRIFVDVPEVDAPFVRDGGPARVRVQALGDREFPARVARSSWLLDAQTRTLRTEIDLPNPEGRLRPGMYVNARLSVEHPNTLTLPSSAVFHQDDQDWVVRVEGNKAVRTSVRLGLREGLRVEVLRKQTRPASRGEPSAWEDFTDAELIVWDNPSALTDGQEVSRPTRRDEVGGAAPAPVRDKGFPGHSEGGRTWPDAELTQRTQVALLRSWAGCRLINPAERPRKDGP